MSSELMALMKAEVTCRNISGKQTSAYSPEFTMNQKYNNNRAPRKNLPKSLLAVSEVFIDYMSFVLGLEVAWSAGSFERYYMQPFITPAKEVILLCPSVCLSVCNINEWTKKSSGKSAVGPGTTH